MPRGGKRANAGAKRKWLEPMTRVYIPVRLREAYDAWLKEQMDGLRRG